MSENLPDNHDQLMNTMDEVYDTTDLLFSVNAGVLDTPKVHERSFAGTQAEAMGTARHIADIAQDAGYEAETEYVEEVETVFDDEDGRHVMRITITKPEQKS